MNTSTDLQARVAVLERELRWAHLKIEALQEELRRERIAKYGPASETLNNLQLELLDEEPAVTVEEVEAESQREPVVADEEERKQHPGRQQLPESLVRVEEVISCPERNCKHCGAETTMIGYDESEVLDVEPARYFVRVVRREKRACRRCHGRSIVMPEATPRIIEKGLASDRMVVETVVAKYCDYLPLYRQASILQREAGLTISRATLDGWVMRVGELLHPVVRAMRQELLAEEYLQADETIVPVQMHDKRGADHQAYLWQYGWPGGATVFDFQLGRGRDGPVKFLGQWNGILQTDGYAAYDRVGGPKLVHIGCWAHARRKFVDAVKLNASDAEAVKMVTRMDALFLVDRASQQQKLSALERYDFRQQHAMEWVNEIHHQCRTLSKTVLPKSALGQAIAYTLNMWPRLARCFEYGQAELSNNLAENSMRPIALGRKNWLHVGSAKAGPKVAAILSVAESCKRLKLPLKKYLTAVLPGMANRTTSEAAKLTPTRWAAARP